MGLVIKVELMGKLSEVAYPWIQHPVQRHLKAVQTQEALGGCAYVFIERPFQGPRMHAVISAEFPDTDILCIKMIQQQAGVTG